LRGEALESLLPATANGGQQTSEPSGN